MTNETGPLRVPLVVFGTDRFWARLGQLATERGHGEHTRFLVGEAERTDRYELRCQECGTAVVEMVVDRSPTKSEGGARAAGQLP